MGNQPTTAITQLLDAAREGDEAAVHRLWPVAHDEVRAVARAHLAREGSASALQATEIVNEVWLRLDGGGVAPWQNRRHFFGAVSNAIRQILIDDVRKGRRLKRGGGRVAVGLEADIPAPESAGGTLIEIDEALHNLEEVDPTGAEVVRMRYLLGLSVEETAAALDVSPRTVNNKWRAARAWLHRELSQERSTANGGEGGP